MFPCSRVGFEGRYESLLFCRQEWRRNTTIPSGRLGSGCRGGGKDRSSRTHRKGKEITLCQLSFIDLHNWIDTGNNLLFFISAFSVTINRESGCGKGYQKIICCICGTINENIIREWNIYPGDRRYAGIGHLCNICGTGTSAVLFLFVLSKPLLRIFQLCSCAKLAWIGLSLIMKQCRLQK